MSRLLKEVKFGSGIALRFNGQEVVVKVRKSRQSENCVRLTIEAAPEVIISGVETLTSQEG